MRRAVQHPGELGECRPDRRRRGDGSDLGEDERAELAMECDVLKRSVALWVKDAMGR
jgi:transposase